MRALSSYGRRAATLLLFGLVGCAHAEAPSLSDEETVLSDAACPAVSPKGLEHTERDEVDWISGDDWSGGLDDGSLGHGEFCFLLYAGNALPIEYYDAGQLNRETDRLHCEFWRSDLRASEVGEQVGRVASSLPHHRIALNDLSGVNTLLSYRRGCNDLERDIRWYRETGGHDDQSGMLSGYLAERGLLHEDD